MKKTEVYDHMETNELESERFILEKSDDNKVVVEVTSDPHFGDLMVAEIWHGEPTGNQCCLGSFRNEVYNFTVTDDSMSSEMLMSEEEE
ncbi:hypothetical protein LMH73_020220 [Vibrio splendidus]|nr:hypothetical protein [Vibrio splendidus]MCC4882461.1 hypothetical protein [Vibrio splendidus]